MWLLDPRLASLAASGALAISVLIDLSDGLQIRNAVAAKLDAERAAAGEAARARRWVPALRMALERFFRPSCTASCSLASCSGSLRGALAWTALEASTFWSGGKGEMSALSRIVYTLVGASALWQLIPLFSGRE